MEDLLDEFNRRMERREETISRLDGRSVEMTQYEQQNKQTEKYNKPSLMDLWHYFMIKGQYFIS